jgi:hypothetical protein
MLWLRCKGTVLHYIYCRCCVYGNVTFLLMRDTFVIVTGDLATDLEGLVSCIVYTRAPVDVTLSQISISGGSSCLLRRAHSPPFMTSPLKQ